MQVLGTASYILFYPHPGCAGSATGGAVAHTQGVEGEGWNNVIGQHGGFAYVCQSY